MVRSGDTRQYLSEPARRGAYSGLRIALVEEECGELAGVGAMALEAPDFRFIVQSDTGVAEVECRLGTLWPLGRRGSGRSLWRLQLH